MAEKVKAEHEKPGPIQVAPQARSLNDCLALERTQLANERTLLAYIRTSLAVLVVGVTIIKFFSSQGMLILGYSLLAIGIGCVTIGLMRFTDMMHKLNELNQCGNPSAIIDED